jgi:hypothetical protein
MGWSKRQFITQSLTECGLASYVFDMEPEEFESALYRLDAMMSDWNGKGIRLGYPLPGSPQSSDLDQQTDVPDEANQAIILNLAMMLAPSYGKTNSPTTAQMAKSSLNTLYMKSTTPPTIRMPNTLPLGAGNKSWNNGGRVFANDQDYDILAGQDGPIDYD